MWTLHDEKKETARKILIHGCYNERRYEVLMQFIKEDGGIEWATAYTRTGHELHPESPRLAPEKMREYCLRTCKDTVQEGQEEGDNVELGDVMYLRFFNEEGVESEVPEGHEAW